MHILYLHQYFTTRDGSGGTRSYEFARHFVSQGHKVTVITSADGREPWSGGRSRRRVVDGIDVVELRAGYADYRSGTARSYGRRIADFVQFALASNLAALGVARPDVVFATSTPLTIGIPGMLASAYHRAPLVFEVRDLWPEAPVQMGALRNPALLLAARALERTIYRYARQIVALSPGMRDGVVDTGIRSEKVAVIPNACDLDLFAPTVDDGNWRAKLGVEGKFVCTYFGTMGEANDLMQVVRAAAVLQARGEDGVVFVLHGDGKQRPALEAACREQGLTNVIFSDATPKREVAQLIAASDLGMTIFKNLPVLGTCSPNKLFDTLAAGKPVLVNTPGWLKHMVEQHACGVFARPDDPEHFADQVVALRNDPERLGQYAQNARRLAEQRFDRRMLAAQLLDVLEGAAAGSSHAIQPASTPK